MARGFVQQSDYKRKENYMKGSIHRLITIGTPHLGGPLSKFLYDHRDDRYCFDENGEILPAEKCDTPIQLKTLIQITQGGIESSIPGSDAYSNLRQTNVNDSENNRCLQNQDPRLCLCFHLIFKKMNHLR
jgi:hypothetical protein